MQIWLWVGFVVLILLLLALDLGVLNRRPHAISVREAVGWTALWVAVAMLFNGLVFVMYGQHWFGLGAGLSGSEAAIQFFAAYVVEKSLSLDNIFVIAMIFSYFRVPAVYQHRVLFWGILGALVMRGIMIFAGIAAIQRFAWLTYLLGALLILTAVKMIMVRHDTIDPDRNPLIRLVRRFYPVTSEFHEQRFFVRKDGVRTATPLMLALVLVESTDLLFAVDSIPAVFAVTLDPFLVFTSNVFAILGLRSLYFALAAFMDRFRYVKFSLAFVLAFVGIKMLLAHHHTIPPLISLAFIIGILAVGVLASLIVKTPDAAALRSPVASVPTPTGSVTLRGVRQLFVFVIGTTLLLLGAVLLVLPGPGLVTILGGLALLATEFVWARVWLGRLKRQMRALANGAQGWMGKTPEPGPAPRDPDPPPR